MSQVSKILKRDMQLFYNDFDDESIISDKSSEDILVSDFTEYNPLHNGHFHCMKTAKDMFPESLFVAIVPGLFERSGRGIPYILPREIRAEIAISVGADIVVEGPPMGIMGSGQYSLCLCKMFQALNTDYIPRGYKPVEGMDEILKRINLGHHIASKPYKIVDKTTHETILKGKLEEDNYVITSFSNSLSKIGFEYKDKFIFVKRIEGVSGTLIRESILDDNFDNVLDMMPKKTIDVLKREIQNDGIIYGIRDEEAILNTANNFSLKELSNLNLFNEKLAINIIENRPYNDILTLEKSIQQGFSSHFKQRVLSILENPIPKKVISHYIDKYPSNIRVLGYKNKETLEKFKEKVNNENISLLRV
ncbi:MAG: nucleotidyltransferase family protein [Methanobrevibacter sp.]|uniref:nucleotidyltransferase family protein n=1 Tax=Methanobrevibacter sp. TaxID=66852 RepID=UPI0025F3181A|nr:nucleotidyltransferase family protein [Methanobrevibacter sp.]MBQ8016678.1 nucleotidyltransferase family protein [Methanobrevibacter sp.]